MPQLVTIRHRSCTLPAGGHQNDPYWAEVWASAIAVSQLIAEDSSLVKGKKVADVGCGLGFVGLCSAKQGVDPP